METTTLITILDAATVLFVASLAASTPLILAALGELVVEKSGVLNLGVEGMMVVGAAVSFIVGIETSNLLLATLAGALAGVLMSLIFGFITLSLQANQVATGLALTIFGVGISAFFAKSYSGIALQGLKPLQLPVLSDLPIVGSLLFSYDSLIYLSIALFFAISWFLGKSRPGLLVLAVGESPRAAHTLGYSVIKIRYMAVMFGGAMAGLGGTYLSIAYTPIWAEGMTAGRGWIALALVVFASWKPTRLLLGALLFGGVTIAQFHLQGAGIGVPTQLLSALPYLATIAVLVYIGRSGRSAKLTAPASLAQPFHPNLH